MKSINSKVLSSIFFLLFFAGCSLRQGVVRSETYSANNDSIRQDWYNADIKALPISGNPLALIEIARELCVPSVSLGQKAYALRLAVHAHTLDKKNIEIAVALSRIAFFAADAVEQNDDMMKKFAGIGVKAARTAGINKSNPEACYYFALNQGLIIRSAGLFAINKLPEIHEALQVAQNAAHLDYGGPLRVLGMLYIKAPAWPSGIGDLDKALDLLRQATEKYPSHPLNYMFYGDALLQDDDKEKALENLETAYRLAVPEIWGLHYSTIWRREIDELKSKASR